MRSLLTRLPALARPVLLATVTLGSGALAVLGTQAHVDARLSDERARLQAPAVETAEVVVARRDLPRGATLDADSFASRAIAADVLPATVVRASDFPRLAGARLASPMRAGEPLLDGSVAGGGALALATALPAGERALTIQVDEVNSLSGMLQPDDRIDLLLSFKRTGTAQDADLTLPLMQNVRVLATGRQVRPGAAQEAEDGARNFSAITVAVLPEQAQRLVVAQRAGRLTATLRNPADPDRSVRRPLDLDDLLQPTRSRQAVTRAELIVGGVAQAPHRQSVDLPAAGGER